MKFILRFLNRIRMLIDLLVFPFVVIFSLFALFVRKYGIEKLQLSKKVFNRVGVFPITDHYYEPLFNPKHLRFSLKNDRELPGINMNTEEQLSFLKKLNYSDELIKIPMEKSNSNEYYYNNSGFESGDAEFLYSLIRYSKPKRIVEIGSGNSTLMAIKAIEKNKSENNIYKCDHICIEPYEMKWLEEKNIKVIRNKVELIDKNVFRNLQEGDILFIDSSHIIRPQGDVLFEYLEMLPLLNTGVFIHIHDIFTPKDYPEEWIINQVRLWNEQYLLEAFLSFNNNFRIISALNYLKHNFPQELFKVCPVLKIKENAEPGSIWLIRE